MRVADTCRVFLGRMVVSLSNDLELEVRKEIQRVYQSKQGAVSIFFEMLIRRYLNGDSESE